MSYGIVLVFDAVDADQYWAVNDRLGIKPDGSGDWPAGMVSHTGGPTATGWVVTEVWNSKADQEAFMASRLGAALGAIGVPAPSQVIESDLVNYQTQLANGFSRITPQQGLEMFMPDLDGNQKPSPSVTLDWLRNRNRSLPPDIPVK